MFIRLSLLYGFVFTFTVLFFGCVNSTCVGPGVFPGSGVGWDFKVWVFVHRGVAEDSVLGSESLRVLRSPVDSELSLSGVSSGEGWTSDELIQGVFPFFWLYGLSWCSREGCKCLLVEELRYVFRPLPSLGSW